MVGIEETVDYLANRLAHSILSAQSNKMRRCLAPRDLIWNASLLKHITLQPIPGERLIRYHDRRKLAEVSRDGHRLSGESSRIVHKWRHEHRCFVDHHGVKLAHGGLPKIGAVDRCREDATARKHFLLKSLEF